MTRNSRYTPGMLGHQLGNGILARNPVLVAAMGMCPVVAAGVTLKNGVALSILLGALLVPSCVLSSVLYRRLPRWLRTPALVMGAAVLYAGAAWALSRMTYNMPAALGIYAPIMVVNSIVISRSEQFAARHTVLPALTDAVSSALGFSVVVCFCSAVRELLAFGTLWGKTVLSGYQSISAVALPCFGFVILGYLAAAVKGIRRKRERRRKKRLRATVPETGRKEDAE